MKNLLPYIYDFLSLLSEDAEVRGKIRRILLFGSVARGEADEESDIDLFIDLWSKDGADDVETHLRETEKRFLIISEKKWNLLGIRQPIKCIIGTLEEPEWKSLKLEIASSGIMLFGKFEEPEDGMMHCAMFSYSLAKLGQAKKMKLLRNLFGYEITKGRKKYGQPGILKECGGTKIGGNVILVPVENSRKIQKLLNSYGITPEIREVKAK